MIDEILEHNREFIKGGAGSQYTAGKYPKKKLAVLTCIDTRLVEPLPAALGVKDGDVKMIKNAGGMITDPFDTSVRSLLIAIPMLGVEEIMVIAHMDCGVAALTPDAIRTRLRDGCGNRTS